MINVKFDQSILVNKLIELQAETKVIFQTQAQILSVLENRKFEEVLEKMEINSNENFNIINLQFMKENKELFDEKFRSEHPEIFE